MADTTQEQVPTAATLETDPKTQARKANWADMDNDGDDDNEQDIGVQGQDNQN